jgi:large subunit ribosomal protein L9
MKVILTQEIDKLGGAHEVVDVAEGYARNFLVPRSLAIPATKSAMANLDNMKKVGERRESRLRAAAEEQAKQFDGKTLIIEAKTGDGGRLFGSVTPADIASALKEQAGIEIDRKQIHLEESIRSAGEYSLPIVLHRDIQPEVKLQVGDLSKVPAKEEAPVVEAPAAEEAPAEPAAA